MKATLYNAKGEKHSQVEMPQVFDSPVREDIAQKYFEAAKTRQPYSPAAEAGRRHSASGRIRHIRHKWRTAYGKGVSRIPRKTMWRRGTQFYWVGAETSGTRGGRRVHGPKPELALKKINKNEMKLAMNSAFAATAEKKFLLSRYSTLDEKSISQVPAVIDSLPIKAKDILETLTKIFDKALPLAIKDRTIRAGRGKMRGRRYKSNAGLLIVTGKNEKVKFAGVEIKSFNNVQISDLFPLGRLTLYTKKALEEMSSNKKEAKK